MHGLVLDLREARLDRGISLRALARATGIHHSVLSRFENEELDPTFECLTRWAAALGLDPSLRLFPSTGPRIYDRWSAPMTNALLAVAHARWRRRLEVGVTRPDRGVIDLVLTAAGTRDVVATEIQGQLRRVEQQLRWAGQKADSLPSAVGWPWEVREPRVGRLLVLRSTSETRALIRGLPELFRAAYPAPEAAAWRALASQDEPWPGNAMLWAEMSGGRARVLDGAPRSSGR